MWFKCQHPAKWLVAEREQTKVNVDADFDRVTFHMRCISCGELVSVKFSTFVGGVDAFLNRKPS